MTSKSETPNPTPSISSDPFGMFGKVQETLLGNMIEMSAAWTEMINDMRAEVSSFVVDRIREDVKTQQDIMNCKTIADVQRVQGEFMEKAMKQYQAETHKLLAIGKASQASISDGKTN